MADDGESLESWLNKATNPSNRQEDWEYIMGFCDQVNKELEGPQISVRLLAHKIQSPQEWEAMQSLMVLEACMKNCGRRFHTEVAKFKFLNELIKVISPKYLGDQVSEKVKTKVIEMLYSWTLSLPDEAKICEAYQMLKSQGVVLVDPEIPLDATLIPSPSPRAKNPVFDDEKKSKRLAQLLKSKKAEDLQEANRLIKNMVKEDEVRTQKATKQKNTLEAVNNSVKLLTEMLTHFSPEDSTDGDKELIKELYSDCDKLRQTVSQIASETEDNDSSLGDILQASDDLSHVINSCQKIVEGLSINGEAVKAQQTQSPVRQEILIDLVGLDTPGGSVSQQQSSVSAPADLLSASVIVDSQSPICNTPSTAFSLLDEELLSLGLNEPVPVPCKSTAVNLSNHVSPLQPVFQDSSQAMDIFAPSSSTAPAFSTSTHFADALPTAVAPVSTSNCSALTTSALSFPGPMYSLTSVSAKTVSTTSATFSQPLNAAVTPAYPGALSGSLSVGLAAPSASPVTPQQVSIPAGASPPPSSSLSCNLQDLALLDLGRLIITPSVPESTTPTPLLLGGILSGSTAPLTKIQADDSPPLRSLSPALPLRQASPGEEQEVSLANVFVPLEAIKPSQACPVTAYDKNGVRVLLHFATECPAGRPDVLVMVASMLNTAPLPVKDIVLQAAVPKMMKVRLQAPTGTELAPFNPILPPAAITQVMLLANPLKEKVRMRYKLTFTLGEQPYTEVGEVNEFPPADRWGAL